MKGLIYSIAFALMFYLAAAACELAGLEDDAKTGILILIAVFTVLGIYIRRKNGGE